MITWPKVPKLSDAIAAIDDLDARVATNTDRLDNLVTAQAARITQLEHELAEHQAGAVKRQAEVDQLKADLARQQWQAQFGRRR